MENGIYYLRKEGLNKKANVFTLAKLLGVQDLNLHPDKSG